MESYTAQKRSHFLEIFQSSSGFVSLHNSGLFLEPVSCSSLLGIHQLFSHCIMLLDGVNVKSFQLHHGLYVSLEREKFPKPTTKA